MEDACIIEGCARPRYKRRNYCNQHYMRLYRYGDPHWVPPRKYVDIAGHQYGTLTVIERLDSTWWTCRCECGELVKRTYADLNRYASPNCGKVGVHLSDDINYFTAHRRVENKRGKASIYVCHCGRPAKQWAYNHQDADELIGNAGKGTAPYSADPNFYEAMCVPCHKKFDLERRVNESLKASV